MNQPLLSRRGWVRVVSYLTAAFLILCGFVIAQHNESLRYQRSLAANQQHAFDELTTAVDEISTALQKASYTNSPDLIAALCTQVYGKASAAQMSMGELPYANVELEQTATFLARVGDYAYAISKTAARNGGWTEEELATWQALSQRAVELDSQLDQLEADIQAGNQTLETVSQAEARLSQETESGDVLSGSLYQDIESEYSELPTLIYDGPFSQHLEGRTPVYLDTLEEVSYRNARQRVATLFDVREGQVAFLSQMEGTIPGWMFSVTAEITTYTVEVSQQGGVPVQFFSDRTVLQPLLTAEECVETASQWLSDQGYDNMEVSYYHQEDGILTANFAYRQDGVLCYPDLIKVSVAMDDGTVVGLDAQGYLMNHTQRTLDTPLLSQDDACQQVPNWVTILSQQMTVIPSDGQYDTLCYEFKCQTESGQHIIYYVNACSGQSEKIFLLLEDESGTLVL